jgi:cytochrome d ubiquinol oxidase subunit II
MASQRTPAALRIIALIMAWHVVQVPRQSDSQRWRQTWPWAVTIGSRLLPVLFGVALGVLLVGLPIGQDGEYTGSFVDLLTPYGVGSG